MRSRSNLFDSIRIKPQKERQKRAETGEPLCQWDGCEAKGEFRAPVGRAKEGEYFRFCLDHVRQYNKGYNYFSGLSDTEIARYQREAMTGHRPTWKVGSLSGTSTGTASAAADVSQMRSGRAAYYNYTGRRQPGRQTGSSEPQARRLKPLERKALRTLDLNDRAGAEDIRTRYKELIKQYHPDSNHGDRASETRFAEVLDAYRLLKRAGFC